jgi:hypothetical protein
MAGIPKFVFEEQFIPGMSILTYGKSWCGKTWFQSYIINKMLNYNFHYGRCFTPSPASRIMYRRYVPEEFIKPPEKELLQEQLDRIRTRANEREGKGLKPEPNFIFTDDCAFKQPFMRCEAMSELMSVGRNYGCTRLHVIQKLTYASPEMRSNADIFACAYENEQTVRRDIYKTWFSMIKDFKTFEGILEEATKDYGFLIINLRKASQARNWRDCISWYRVEGDPTKGPMCEILPHNLYIISKLRKSNKVKKAEEKQAEPKAANGAAVRLDTNGDVYELPNLPAYDSIVNAAADMSSSLPMPDWISTINNV